MPNFGVKHTQQTKIKMRLHHKGMSGKKHSEITKQKIGKANAVALKGKQVPLEVRKKISLTLKKRVLAGLHNNYKGGIEGKNSAIKRSLQYQLWRQEVFKRDNFQCVNCGYQSKGTKPSDIHADHIKQFAYFPELRFDINNGRTLCIPCHRQTLTWGPRHVILSSANELPIKS